MTDFFASRAINGTISCDQFYANEAPQVCLLPRAHQETSTYVWQTLCSSCACFDYAMRFACCMESYIWLHISSWRSDSLFASAISMYYS